MNIALTIAGSDSGGGAGIQADLKTFHQFGVFGTSAVVAVTAQNTRGVDSVHTIPPGVVAAQLQSLADDLRPHAFKTGMLGTGDLVEEVAAAIKKHNLTNFVLDPVMVATSGDPLLEHGAARAIRKLLMPLCDLITPNIPEAEILSDLAITNVEDMAAAAERMVAMGAGGALVKGGHMNRELVTDVFCFEGRTETFEKPRLETRSTHGTGCTLSAAITAGLAKGHHMLESVAAGLEFVHRAIATAPGLGSGNGPLNHFSEMP